MSKQKIISVLRELTKHDYLEIVTRGNSAISSALAIISGKVLIPEEGGWLHYQTAPKMLGLELMEVKCNDAKIDLADLENKATKCDVFLYHNPGGYFAEQPMKEIYQICQKNNCLVVMDCSGSIGTKLCNGKYADIIVGSFGKWKLVEARVGGFISCNNNELWKKIVPEKLEAESDQLKVLQKLEELPDRIRYLENIRDKVINDLSNYDIVRREDLGFVVVVKFSNKSEKENKNPNRSKLRGIFNVGSKSKVTASSGVLDPSQTNKKMQKHFELSQKESIINYCVKNKLPYTECPRYIRLNEKAISIEIKRM